MLGSAVAPAVLPRDRYAGPAACGGQSARIMLDIVFVKNNPRLVRKPEPLFKHRPEPNLI